MTTKTYAELGTFSSVSANFLIAGWDPAGPGPLKTGQASVWKTYFLSGLGTASVADTGTSGAKVPLLNAANTWSAAQTFSQRAIFSNGLTSSSSVGIGVTPFTALDVGSTSRVRWDVAGAAVTQTVSDVAGSTYANYYSDAATHRWYVAGTETMRMDASSNLFLFTTTQLDGALTAKLNIFAGSDNGITMQASNTSWNCLTFLDVSGTVVGSVANNNTSIAYNTTSDGRRKTIEGAYAPGDLFDRIAVYDVTWDNGHPGVAVIAQELQQVAPQWVTPGDDDVSRKPGDDGFRAWATQISEPLAAIMAEVKALRARVAALEAA